MGEGTRVRNSCAAPPVLRTPTRHVGLRPVRLLEPSHRDSECQTPELIRVDDVEAIMEVQAPNLDQAEARIGRVGDLLPPAGSWVTPSTNPIGSASPNRSDTTPSASGRNVPTDVAPSSPTSHS